MGSNNSFLPSIFKREAEWPNHVTAINTDGQIVGIDDLATQTRQVFENIKSALETSELKFNDVVKLTFF
ncbi:hypothetical protein COL80_01760 [Bacillus thuringiensis]|nr:hypothetical protein COL80_01760 [Bacillus thuringiensis]